MESAYPSGDEVRRISALSDPVLRNLRITLGYHRLSGALAQLLGPGSNWCTVATWASRQAGESIRGEDTLRLMERRLRTPAQLRYPAQSFWRAALRAGVFEPETRLGRVVRGIHSPFDVFEQVSAAVAAGNLKVFEEIALVFAIYLDRCGDDGSIDSAAFRDFLEQLQPGDPPGGQRYLRQSFTHYHASRNEPNPARKTQLRLLANLEIGFHEQTRLQTEIVSALESPVNVASSLPQPLPLRLMGKRLHNHSVALTRRITTECLMEMKLPGRIVLGLGRDIDVPFPPSVRNPDLPDLVAFLSRVGAAARKVGADDWGNIDQRMNYIANVFRTFHEYTELFQPPFTPYQIRLIQGGFVPDGDL